MNIPQQNLRERNQDRGSKLSRGWRDLNTPLGSSIFGTIVICGIISIVIDYIGEFLNIPQSIINIIILIIIAIATAILIYKVASASKRAMQNQREVYQRKFGGNRKDEESK